MDKDIAISVENVTMSFILNKEKVDNLKEYAIKLITGKLEYNKFDALKDINFKVKKGEHLAIMGLNGAGKSTLLKTIVGVYKPTKGKIEKQGVIAPLLELGAGFDGNYSGRENIFLYGAILGYSREFIQSKYDEIVEFSELGDFIEVPVKNYSSGMKSRLGFSIATAVEPDVLILDEVLSVGDAGFRKKSLAKVQSLFDSGVTVLFVSHSIDQVMAICDTAILLDHGKIISQGPVEEVTQVYNEKVSSPKKNKKLFEYGDLIRIKGEYYAPEIARNYKGFDYSQYLKTLNIYGAIKVEEAKIINKNQLSPILININNVREKMIYNANKNMPQRTANLLLGILIGERDNIPEDIVESFRTANLSHILAVSGAHTSYIILGITYLISKSKTPKRIGYIITIIVLLLFIIITGASYSVIRACIMAIVVIGAKICYRKENFFTSICISLIIILIQNPFAINDIGLKLSFMGTVGIIIFNKNIKEIFVKLKIKNKIAEALSITFSAQLMIMPITILNFNTVSLTFFISNILASPLLGIIIILGFASIFIFFILEPISKILFLILHALLELLIVISKFTANIPGSEILVKTPNIIFAIIYYILILFSRFHLQ